MPEKIKLYRVENPNIPADPRLENEGGTSHPDLRGQWFSDRLDKALSYLPKATQYKPGGDFRRPFEAIDGAVLHIAEIDADELGTHLAKNHPDVQAYDMDIEPKEDYILPLDKITSTIPLDELAGESRGKMNNLTERIKAIDRVRGAVALHLDELDSKK